MIRLLSQYETTTNRVLNQTDRKTMEWKIVPAPDLENYFLHFYFWKIGKKSSPYLYVFKNYTPDVLPLSCGFWSNSVPLIPTAGLIYTKGLPKDFLWKCRPLHFIDCGRKDHESFNTPVSNLGKHNGKCEICSGWTILCAARVTKLSKSFQANRNIVYP